MIIEFKTYINESIEENGVPILEFNPSIAKDIENFKKWVKNAALDANINLREQLLQKLLGQKIKVKGNDDKFIVNRMGSNYPDICFIGERGDNNMPNRYFFNSHDFCKDPNSIITVYPRKRKYTEDDPYGEEEWENESFINENYKEFNRKVDYEIISTLTRQEFQNITFKYLNEHYTGWIILENLEHYIIRIVKWKSRDIFVYDAFYSRFHNNSELKEIVPTEFNSHKNYYNNIYKVEIKGIREKQKFTEEDPYGEEDWYD